MPKITYYLDTSSWNHLLNGKMSVLNDAIGRADSCVLYYSTQSIVELLGVRDEQKRSALDLQLDMAGARHLETVSETEGGKPTDYMITLRDRGQRGQIYDDMLRFSPVGGFGIGDLLQKAIGGISSMSHEDIAAKALADFERLLDFDVSDLPNEVVEAVLTLTSDMMERARHAQAELLDQLNRQPEEQLKQMESARINNFTGSGAVERIIQAAKQQDATAALVDAFLCSHPAIPSVRLDAHLATPSWEQVSRLSQLLFLLGYWREPKHRKDSEQARIDFAGGQSDICHIANAFFCSVFYTSDKPQAQVAAAVYDHLNVPTIVILYTPATHEEVVLYFPSRIRAIDE